MRDMGNVAWKILDAEVAGALVDVLRFRLDACDPAQGVDEIGLCLSTLISVLVGHTTGRCAQICRKK